MKQFPIYVRPRLRGVDCFIRNGFPMLHQTGVALRKQTPLPNRVVTDILSGLPPMLGTLVCGPVDAKDAGKRTRELMLVTGGAPEFTFWAWDVATAIPRPFTERLLLLGSYANASPSVCVAAPWRLILNAAALRDYENAQFDLGFAAIVKQDPEGTVDAKRRRA